jgi:hypothetical protein
MMLTICILQKTSLNYYPGNHNPIYELMVLQKNLRQKKIGGKCLIKSLMNGGKVGKANNFYLLYCILL